MIGLSPLSTTHPSSFQPTSVRSSTRCYPGFNLAMDRSLRFRVCPHVLRRPFQTRFRYGSGPEGLNLAREEQLAGSLCKRHAVTHVSSVDETRLLPLVCTRFQVLFHSPSGVLFTFPSRYYSLSVTSSYLALEDGPPIFERGFTCPALLGYPSSHLLAFRVRDCHPLWSAIPGAFCYTFESIP